ncbi:hypothetical protein MTR_4g033800 [Medicago truncatula]|uniref:Uncharacterized protein n=1 Tax=Medicago truncatula TaxID=3880 RepID=G7JP92_MEDTR|nr:hypothetical protein MTR_4g033800 [Medicago truncatula]
MSLLKSKYAIIPEIVSFVNYTSEINKTSITPLKLHKKYIGGGVEEIQKLHDGKKLEKLLVVVKGLMKLKEVMVDVRLVVI